MILPPDGQGHIRFAAISRTALGTRCARLNDLQKFYSRLPKLQCDKVIHLGGVTETAAPELAKIYPRVEGVTTVELANGSFAPCGGRMLREGRADWVTTPNKIPLALRALEGIKNETVLCLYYDRSGDRGLSEIADEVYERDSERGRMEGGNTSFVILVGGQRRLAHRYFQNTTRTTCFVGSVGVFDARASVKNPPAPYGGSIVEVKLHGDGSLDTCTLTFRDMSGGMPDV
jgi:hypothetical protein